MGKLVLTLPVARQLLAAFLGFLQSETAYKERDLVLGLSCMMRSRLHHSGRKGSVLGAQSGLEACATTAGLAAVLCEKPVRPETDAPRNEALSGRAFNIILAHNIYLGPPSSPLAVLPACANRKVAKSGLRADRLGGCAPPLHADSEDHSYSLILSI